MADSAFELPSAPTGAPRQFTALASIFNLKQSRNNQASKPKGLSAKNQAALMERQHGYNMELESHRGNVAKDLASHKGGIAQKNEVMGVVARHVTGQEASKQTHKQTMAQNRQANKHELTKMNQEHIQNTDNTINANNHERAMATQNHRQSLAAVKIAGSNPAISSYKSPSGTSVQFNGVQSSE